MRLLASDIDGTLLPRLGPITDRTVSALRGAEDAGVHVVLATGRPPRWMTEIAARTRIAGHAVLANGAVVVDLQRVGDADHGVVRTRTIAVEEVLQLAHDLRAEMPGIHFAVESVTWFGVEPGWPQAIEADLPRADLVELLRRSGPVVKLLAKAAEGADPFGPADPDGPATHASSSTAGDDMLEIARRVTAGRGEPTHSGSQSPLVEIGPPGVDKAATLAEVAAELGVDRTDVVAFGDMPNDVAMLRWAGTGYAMTGGHPAAVEAADRLAPPCHEDGVAQVVEQLLAGGTRRGTGRAGA
ncbi:HAD family hydrolase [Aquipuribacter sp. MA13-6]|uniref:HAD family hydrolase n=1 Tax=unclassified Aquipuribacter TaxID=2635084 RepID=UPI003EECA621